MPFVAAHVALARLGCAIPENRGLSENPSVRALAACGAILYWSNRIDLDEDEMQRGCAPELRILTWGARDAALDVIRECEYVSRGGCDLLPGDGPVVHSIVERFPAETVGIYRDALLEPEKKVGYFRHFSRFDRNKVLAFAISVLGHHGRGADRAVLRMYARTTEFGEGAIRALRSIEERLASSVESAA